MVQAQKKLQTLINEFEAIGEKKMAALLAKSISNSLKAIDADIKQIELKIMGWHRLLLLSLIKN